MKRRRSFVRDLNVDLVGVADLESLHGMSICAPFDSRILLPRFRYAIVLGAQLGKLRPNASGSETALFLERAAFELMCHLNERKHSGLIIHRDDEFDPTNRLALMSLKALAKAAGLGWQGRSLLIVSPQYGPIHRLVAVLTDMPLQADQPIPNQCGGCSLCVEKCPRNALTLVRFDDHPQHREDVLNVELCSGDDGCPVCLAICPWAKPHLLTLLNRKQNSTAATKIVVS